MSAKSPKDKPAVTGDSNMPDQVANNSDVKPNKAMPASQSNNEASVPQRDAQDITGLIKTDTGFCVVDDQGNRISYF